MSEFDISIAMFRAMQKNGGRLPTMDELQSQYRI